MLFVHWFLLWQLSRPAASPSERGGIKDQIFFLLSRSSKERKERKKEKKERERKRKERKRRRKERKRKRKERKKKKKERKKEKKERKKRKETLTHSHISLENEGRKDSQQVIFSFSVRVLIGVFSWLAARESERE